MCLGLWASRHRLCITCHPFATPVVVSFRPRYDMHIEKHHMGPAASYELHCDLELRLACLILGRSRNTKCIAGVSDPLPDHDKIKRATAGGGTVSQIQLSPLAAQAFCKDSLYIGFYVVRIFHQRRPSRVDNRATGKSADVGILK